jgi:hypothetical protein
MKIWLGPTVLLATVASVAGWLWQFLPFVKALLPW